MKKNISGPPHERYWLLDFPLQILWATVVLGLVRISFSLWHRYRQKEKISTSPQISKPVQIAYDKWPWKQLVLGLQINKARRKFQKSPGARSCACLRELLARRSATRLLNKNKLTVAEVCALTAGELAQLGGRKQDIAELLQLDHQLESGHYDTLRDTSQEGGK